MKSTLLIIVTGCIAINLPLIQAKSLRLQKRAAFYIANETACIVDSIVYYNGDPIPTDDPCEACKCRPPGFACVLRECEVKPGCRAVRKAGHCCPEYVCGCEHNGRMYRDGDEIRDSQNPCYTCHCQGSAIACAFVDCFFRVDCAPDYVPGECCPRYDHCSPLASTTSESRETTSAIPPTTSQAPIEKDIPETTIKVEVFTELSLFGLPNLGIDESIDDIRGPQPASESKPTDRNQPGSEGPRDQSTSMTTTPETNSTTTAKNNQQPNSTVPVFYIPKEEVVNEEEVSEESVKEPEPKKPLPSEAVGDDSPKADEVVTSDDNQSSSKPELYVSSDDSKSTEESSILTTESSDKSVPSEVHDAKDTKQDSSNEKEAEHAKKIPTTTSYPVTTLATSEKTVADAPVTTPIPVLFLNAKVTDISSEEKEKLYEDTTTDKVVEESVITTEFVEEVSDQKQTTPSAPSLSTEETTNEVIISKSNRSGKQNEDEDQAAIATTAVSETEKNTEVKIATEKEDALLHSTISLEGTSSTTLSEEIPSVSTTLESVQADDITTKAPEEKVPSIYAKKIDESELKSSTNNTKDNVVTTEDKLSPQTTKLIESINETATESNVITKTTTALPQTEVTITSDSKTIIEESKVAYKE